MAANLTLTVKVNDASLRSLEQRIRRLEGKTIQVTAQANGLDSTNSSVQNLNQNVQQTTNSVSDLGTAFVAKVKWGLIQSSIQGIANAFMMAVDNMKEVDTQITNIAKVTDQSVEQLSALQEKAYSTASKYGVGAGQYMEAVYEYTKAGFADNADQMAELSTKAMLVGDTTAAVADKFLIAGNAAFGMEGNIQKLSLMVDQADYINNKYATTLDKIAEGFPRVASVASMAGMTAEETMAALGTITATTQETASRASTALRALIINILGDTSTEIEDGVTATEDSINGLRDALNKYAPDVVKAADATGKLINPMKALKSLSEAYKRGDLTESGLFEIESALGGKLRTNQLDALLKNFDTYEKMLAGMADAAGTADEEIGIMLTSWESKTKILENTWTEFVSKSFNSNVFKGAIDGLTQLLNLFGDLNHMVATVGGGIAVGAMFKQISSLKAYTGALSTQMQDMVRTGQMGTEQFKQMGDSLANAGNKLNALQVAAPVVAGITAAYTAATVLQNYVDQKRQEQMQQATKASESIASLVSSYQDYQNAVVSANSGAEESIAGVQEATESLKEALESTGISAVGAAENIETAFARTMTVLRSQVEVGVSAAEGVLKDAFSKATLTQGDATAEMAYPLLQFMGYWDLNQVGEIDLYHEYYTSAEQLLEYYDLLVDAQGKLAESGQTSSGEYQKLSEIITELTPSVSAYREQLEQLDKLKAYEGIEKYGDALKSASSAQELMARRGELLSHLGINTEAGVAVIDEYIRSIAEANELMSEIGWVSEEVESNISKQADAYKSLADRIREANVALENYNTQTKVQQGDEYTQYVEAYEKFLEDWEKGFKGSTNVKAAEELFFTNEQITAMRKRGVDAGEVLASDFMQSLYTHMEEDGREFNKEDMGAYAAFALFDDTEGQNLADGYSRVADQIIDKHGHLVAEFKHSIDENGEEEVQVVTHNMELLADALGVAPEVVAAWVDAWGVFDSSIEATAGDITKLANSFGALQELNGVGVIDVSQLIQGLGEAGAQAGTLWDYVERLKELQASGDLNLDMDLNTDEGNQKVAELIDHYAHADDEPLEAEVETDKAKGEIDSLSAYGNSQVIRPTVSAPTESAKSALDGLKAYGDSMVIRPTVEVSTAIDKKASGTDDAPGGLTLVNEGTGANAGPEIIVEDGKARIAGGGKPALTIVDKGATIFNAQETRKIFERSGINAYGDGWETGGIKRPKGSSGGTTSSSGSGTTSSGTETSSYTPPAVDTTPAEDVNAKIEALKKQVELMKSLANWSEAASDASWLRVQREQDVADAIWTQLQYMIANGGEQTEINNLWAEYYNQLEAVKKLQQEDKESAVEAAEKRVSLLQSELDLLEARNRPVEEQVAKQQEIIKAINAQIRAARAAGADEEEINKLLLDRVNIRKAIRELQREEREAAKEKEQEKKEKAADRQSNRVDNLKSQYDLWEKMGLSVEKRIKKQKEIRDAIGEEIKLMKAAGASAAEINRLKIEQLEIDEKIKELENENAKEAAERQADRVSRMKSYLDLYVAQDKSIRKQILQQRKIAEAIRKEIELKQKAGATQEEINRLKAEELDIYKQIEEMEQSMFDEVREAAQREIDALDESRNKELEALKEVNDEKEKEEELEEKLLAIEEARDKLRNAELEKTVRIYNAAKGQWEWVANAKDIESARKDLESAQKSYDDYISEQELDAREAEINKKYDDQIEQWQKVIDELTEPVKSFKQVVNELGKNATEAMRTTINALNEILDPLGYRIKTNKLYDNGGVLQGMGGIKATSADEMVLPPDISRAMLNPIRTTMFDRSMDELRYMYGLANSQNNSNNFSGDQYNNPTYYQYGGVTLTEAQAKSTTIYELAKMSRGLRTYVATSK